ncbi:MBL fold metallo-hydrolase [Streptomyces sp. NPDC048275]|uniref:MBL fold metallo-hydrolase n=1 Tax=Streptomyces sp. NPDC048275 TaxID=3155629 RepID=UPI0033E7BECC
MDWTTRPGYLEDGQLILSFGSFLIRAGGRRILVDLAVGKVDVDLPGVARLKGGSLLQNLAAEGLSTDGIDTVVYTHLHLDHVGWTSDVAPLPNAPARPDTLIAAGHFTDDVFGRVTSVGDAHAWDPVGGSPSSR